MIRISASTILTSRLQACTEALALRLRFRDRRGIGLSTWRRKPLQNQPNEGFTLVEVLIVIGLIALIMSFVVPNLGMALKVNLGNSSRELATLIRSTHDEAVLKGTVHRVVFDLDRSQYWVEIGDRNFLMRSSEQEEDERRRKERLTEEEREKLKDPFSLAQSLTKKKIALPKGVKFNDVITSRSREPVKGGLAYAHVFPHGFVEKLIIHLKDDFERDATLIVNSVTGKSRVFESYVKEDEK
ncbi:MAG: prepilin-type N-terminal cleavage/methylation domain-containing protein [Bdellovibrionota bacterium]